MILALLPPSRHLFPSSGGSRWLVGVRVALSDIPPARSKDVESFSRRSEKRSNWSSNKDLKIDRRLVLVDFYGVRG